MMTQAWQGAALTRANKLPDLKQLLADFSPKDRKAWQEAEAYKIMHHMRLAKAQLEANEGTPA